ncbi:hypothetical protein [Neptunomonas sp.]|uniref:hypothetical protein n=1 Tax=Neptunomonas sp. TaxID=1971898 RepID=UPI0035687E7D
MSINLHIDTLVLDGLDIQPHQVLALKEAVEAVLTHQLTLQNQADTSSQSLFATAFAASGILENQPVNAGQISINRSQSMEDLGQKIGNAVYWGIRK